MALLVLLAAVFSSTLALEGLPKSACSLGEPQEQLDTCLLGYIQSVTPTVATTGVPELGLKPPLDPLALPNITVKLNSKFIKGVVVLNNTVLEGLKHTQIKQVKSSFGDAKKLFLEVIAANKHLRIQGLYDHKLAVGTNPIAGSGDFKLSVRNVRTRVRIHSHIVLKGGKKYVHVDRVQVKPNIGKLKIESLNMDLNDKQMEALVLETIKTLWPQIYSAVYPHVEPHIAKIVQTKINDLTLKVPFLDLINE